MTISKEVRVGIFALVSAVGGVALGFAAPPLVNVAAIATAPLGNYLYDGFKRLGAGQRAALTVQLEDAARAILTGVARELRQQLLDTGAGAEWARSNQNEAEWAQRWLAALPDRAAGDLATTDDMAMLLAANTAASPPDVPAALVADYEAFMRDAGSPAANPATRAFARRMRERLPALLQTAATEAIMQAPTIQWLAVISYHHLLLERQEAHRALDLPLERRLAEVIAAGHRRCAEQGRQFTTLDILAALLAIPGSLTARSLDRVRPGARKKISEMLAVAFKSAASRGGLGESYNSLAAMHEARRLAIRAEATQVTEHELLLALVQLAGQSGNVTKVLRREGVALYDLLSAAEGLIAAETDDSVPLEMLVLPE